MLRYKKFFIILIFFGMSIEEQAVFAQEISSKKNLGSDGQISLKEITIRAQEAQNSLAVLEMVLHEKSEKLLKYRREVGHLLSALLEFSRPSIQKVLIFSTPDKYVHLSILLESLIKKVQEGIFDLRQEIAEVNYLMFLRQQQILKYRTLKRPLEIQKKQTLAN